MLHSGSSSVGLIKCLSVLCVKEISAVPCIFCWMNAGLAAPLVLEASGFEGMPPTEAIMRCWRQTLAQERSGMVLCKSKEVPAS